MNVPLCIVAVDVGNSAIKLAVQREGSIVDHSIRFGTTDWEHSAIRWVRDQLGCQQTQWRIASVHRSAADRLIRAIGQAQADAVIDRVTRRDVPMQVQVDHPERVGIDRLLSVYAAWNRWQGQAVVVDAGSAVTIDWVDSEGRFCGGAILPGLALQSRALATGTDALPQIEWDPGRQIHLPAKNTSDAIFAGILLGVAATVDRLTDDYSRAVGTPSENVLVVLTGGDARALFRTSGILTR